jgi:hypothetical protein
LPIIAATPSSAAFPVSEPVRVRKRDMRLMSGFRLATDAAG